VGGLTIDAEIVVASIVPIFEEDRFAGYRLRVGTTDNVLPGLGYYAELAPLGLFHRSELCGDLKCDDHPGEALHVRGIYAANSDGTSRIDVTIEPYVDDSAHERELGDAANDFVAPER
jgi:hypothetical protein